MKDIKKIDKLLAKFYSADISQKEMDVLFYYFLHTGPLPQRYAADELLIRSLAIERYCRADKENMRRRLLAVNLAAPKRRTLWPPIARYTYIATGVAAAVVAIILLKPTNVVAQSSPTPLTVYCNYDCNQQHIIDQFETTMCIK